MVEAINETVQEGKDNLKPMAMGAAGIGLGSMLLGPGIGIPVGATAAGAMAGGTAGTALTVVAGAFGLASLIFGNPFRGDVGIMGSSGNSGGGRRKL